MKAFMKQFGMIALTLVLRQGLKTDEMVELVRRTCADRNWYGMRED